jgi:hypothetical protein
VPNLHIDFASNIRGFRSVSGPAPYWDGADGNEGLGCLAVDLPDATAVFEATLLVAEGGSLDGFALKHDSETVSALVEVYANDSPVLSLDDPSGGEWQDAWFMFDPMSFDVLPFALPTGGVTLRFEVGSGDGTFKLDDLKFTNATLIVPNRRRATLYPLNPTRLY